MTYPCNIVSFIDCEMGAKLTAGSGAWNYYNAVFVGYSANAQVLNFTNCKNTGELVSGQASMFAANVAYKTIEINITNCRNEGLIKHVYVEGSSNESYFNPIVSVTNDGSHTALKVTIDGTAYAAKTIPSISPTIFGGLFVKGSEVLDMALSLNEDGTFTITPSSINNVNYYIVSVGIYAAYKDGGTSLKLISEKIMADSDLTVGLKNLQFVDQLWVENHSAASRNEKDGYVTYTLDGVEYYYMSDANSTLNGQPNSLTEFGITACDAKGNMLGAVGLSK